MRQAALSRRASHLDHCLSIYANVAALIGAQHVSDSELIQYIFGFACGSFQYGRVVMYLSFASNRSLWKSFSVSCIAARSLLAVVGPTPYTEFAYTARLPYTATRSATCFARVRSFRSSSVRSRFRRRFACASRTVHADHP